MPGPVLQAHLHVTSFNPQRNFMGYIPLLSLSHREETVAYRPNFPKIT